MPRNILLPLIFFATAGQAQFNNNPNGRFMQTSTGTLNQAAVFTVEFWVKTTESRSNDVYWQRPYLFGDETDGDNSGDMGITTNDGYIGMWEGISNLNTDQQFLSTSVRVNDNYWHHIAAVNNGQTLSLYVDGNIVGSLVSGRRLLTNSAPLTFGAASLDHNFSGNYNNTNFYSLASFGDARISGTARYTANFNPPPSCTSDAGTVALYHLNDQTDYGNTGNNTVPVTTVPGYPVTFDPGQAVNNDYAQEVTLFINDSVALNGRLLLAKKDWSLNSEIGIHFFEGNSRKAKFYKAEDIKGFQMGDNYFESELLAAGAPVSTPLKKTIVRRLTEMDSRIGMYEYIAHTTAKDPSGYVATTTTTVYFIRLPGAADEKIYPFGANKFVPHFETRVSALLADKPALAEKIKSKNKDYFYAFVTEASHQLKVWWNIINEYNQP